MTSFLSGGKVVARLVVNFFFLPIRLSLAVLDGVNLCYGG